MDLRVDGKVALVTGGSRGIGLAIAARLAAAGAHVMLSARTAETLEAAASSLSGRDGEVAWFAANAGDPEGAAACVTATVERFGGVDILVNNAATNPYMGRVIDIDRARAEKTVSVNLEALVTWSQCAYRASLAARRGSIVNISSIGGMGVEPGIGWYNVTKAAVIHLTRQLAYELGPEVRVNAVAPGLVKTDFARALWEHAGDAVAARLPLRRIGEPDDIGKVVLFLVSEAAAWMTGATVVVDGGATSLPSGGV